jgi:hypothetical protein
VCTSHLCSKATAASFASTEEYVNYEDMDNQID